MTIAGEMATLPNLATDPGGFLAALARWPDDTPWPLGEAALALAALEGDAPPLQPYLRTLEGLKRDMHRAVMDAPPADADAAAALLSRVLIKEGGFGGDSETYDDLRNANLIRVIDRRRGLPVALGILGIALGREIGWQVNGLAFPGHFLVALAAEGGRAVIDLFHGGITLEAEALRGMLKAAQGADAELGPRHYAPVPDRDVLLRLQNNLKTRLIQAGDLAGAADTVDRMLIIAPERAGLHREAGLINAHAGRLTRAIGALEAYLERETMDGPRRDARALIDKLRGQLN